MSTLAKLKCLPCRADSPPASDAEIAAAMPQLKDWQIVEVNGIKRLQRSFTFQDFASALEFTVRVGHAAEEQDHHPSLLVEWGRVTVTWWTHAIRGLHRNDFIMAARTDALYSAHG